jgi:hypothetical protein
MSNNHISEFSRSDDTQISCKTCASEYSIFIITIAYQHILGAKLTILNRSVNAFFFFW